MIRHAHMSYGILLVPCVTQKSNSQSTYRFNRKWMQCVHKKSPYGLKNWLAVLHVPLIWMQPKIANGKAFRNLLPKTKSKPTNAFLKFRSELEKILND